MRKALAPLFLAALLGACSDDDPTDAQASPGGSGGQAGASAAGTGGGAGSVAGTGPGAGQGGGAGAAGGAACVPGASVACVGPGACQGGQVCKADGSGFGPCDCGAGGQGGQGGVSAGAAGVGGSGGAGGSTAGAGGQGGAGEGGSAGSPTAGQAGAAGEASAGSGGAGGSSGAAGASGQGGASGGGGSTPACVHSPCEAGAALVKDCSSCAAKVCATRNVCCEQSLGWDGACVDLAKIVCTECGGDPEAPVCYPADTQSTTGKVCATCTSAKTTILPSFPVGFGFDTSQGGADVEIEEGYVQQFSKVLGQETLACGLHVSQIMFAGNIVFRVATKKGAPTNATVRANFPPNPSNPCGPIVGPPTFVGPIGTYETSGSFFVTKEFGCEDLGDLDAECPPIGSDVLLCARCDDTSDDKCGADMDAIVPKLEPIAQGLLGRAIQRHLASVGHGKCPTNPTEPILGTACPVPGFPIDLLP